LSVPASMRTNVVLPVPFCTPPTRTRKAHVNQPSANPFKCPHRA
jgi:hypothetical protein